MSRLDSITHHATLFVQSDRKEFTQKLWDELTAQSVHHVLHDHTVIDIDTARALRGWAVAGSSERKTALLSFHTITFPAQNALLKIVEEPNPNVTFVFVTSNKEALLPTLYSRLQHIQTEGLSAVMPLARLFLATPHTERIKLPQIVKLLSLKDEEGRKDREGIRTFILSLVDTLPRTLEYAHYHTIGLETASYASDPSSSGKALIEYLALLLPEVKV